MSLNAGVHRRGLPVSLGRAARRAGLSVDEFRAAADPLNGTAEDLRVAESGPPARYDPERLARWIQAFRYPEEKSTIKSSSSEAVPVTARWTGKGWVLSALEHDRQTTAARLITAKRRLAQMLAPVLAKPPAEVELEITWELDRVAMQLWNESLEFKDLARQLLTLAAYKRDSSIAMLTADGMTGPEIGAALGVSHQRVQQLLARGKARDSGASAEAVD